MPKFSKDAMQVEDPGPLRVHEGEAGGYICNFLQFHVDVDATPLLKGMPDDRCQCEHWGYVIKGRLTFRYPDHDETVEAGEAFYCRPGHIPVGNEPGTEYVQWSPAEDIRRVAEVMKANMERMHAGAHG
jgi:hypothetical protein